MDKKIFWSVIVVTVSALVILLSLTYNTTFSYFTTTIDTSGYSGAGNGKTGLTAGEITGDVVLSGSTDIFGDKIYPGTSLNYTFTISNPNTIDVPVSLYWTNVTNSFINKNDLQITLKDSNQKDIITAANNKTFPKSNNEDLVTNLVVPKGGPTTYTLTINYINTSQNQFGDMGKTFQGTINIKSYEE